MVTYNQASRREHCGVLMKGGKSIDYATFLAKSIAQLGVMKCSIMTERSIYARTKVQPNQ
jgi:hypothetical protein